MPRTSLVHVPNARAQLSARVERHKVSRWRAGRELTRLARMDMCSRRRKSTMQNSHRSSEDDSPRVKVTQCRNPRVTSTFMITFGA